MPSTSWFDFQSIPILLELAETRKFRGSLLPGSVVRMSASKDYKIIQQDWEHGRYRVGYRILLFFKKQLIKVKEVNGIRLEAVLEGELNISSRGGQPIRLIPGQYHLTGNNEFTTSFNKDTGCQYFVSYYPLELIRELGFEDFVQPTAPLMMPENMRQVIHEALHHPHSGQVKDLYYRKLVMELLYIHLTTNKVKMPEGISEADIAAAYRADAILSADLSEHYLIPKLASLVGMNAVKLKRTFQLIFKIGLFGRLMDRRMKQAKVLLETTSKTVKEIAFESGYGTVAGFITAFRKRFGVPPLIYREQQAGRKNESNSG
jgi:AraC-like DNA-binding protein